MSGNSRKIVPRLKRGIFFVACLLPVGVVAEPYRPDSPDTILEQLPRVSARPASGRIEDPELAAQVARSFIERNRRTGDARLLGYAQGVLGPWWEHAKPPDAILLMRATLRQALHEFDASLADLEQLLGRDPTNVQAWLTQASVLRVQGRYAEAAAACEKLTGRSEALIERICSLSVRSHMGALHESLDALDSIRRNVLYQPRPVIAWYYLERSDAQLRAGQLTAAQRSFEYALSRFPEHLPLRLGYADFLLDQKQYSPVLDLIAPDESSEALILRRALALRALKDPEYKTLSKKLRAGFRSSRRRDDATHLREEVRYRLAAGHPIEKIIPLAQANWQAQREPWDARLLIDCANRAGNSAIARPVKLWLQQTGLQDVRLPPIARP